MFPLLETDEVTEDVVEVAFFHAYCSDQLLWHM